MCISHNSSFSIPVICTKYVSSKNVGTDDLSCLSTFENVHGEIARELLPQPRTGQRDLCGHILGIVIAHEIMNKQQAKQISMILLAHHNI